MATSGSGREPSQTHRRPLQRSLLRENRGRTQAEPLLPPHRRRTARNENETPSNLHESGVQAASGGYHRGDASEPSDVELLSCELSGSPFHDGLSVCAAGRKDVRASTSY